MPASDWNPKLGIVKKRHRGVDIIECTVCTKRVLVPDKLEINSTPFVCNNCQQAKEKQDENGHD